jgi:hypothetical protein
MFWLLNVSAVCQRVESFPGRLYIYTYIYVWHASGEWEANYETWKGKRKLFITLYIYFLNISMTLGIQSNL